MNIEELARQAGIDLEVHMPISRGPIWIATQQELEAFAALVLEQAAKACDDQDQEYEPYTGQPRMLQYQCAEAIRAMKP